MDKYGVDTEDLEKTADAKKSGACPSCGEKLEFYGKVVLCPNCGSEPKEEPK